MLHGAAAAAACKPTPVTPVLQSSLDGALEALGGAAAAWASTAKFGAKSGELLLVPGADGGVERVLLGLDSPTDVWGYAALGKLPAGGGGKGEAGAEGGGALYALERLPVAEAGGGKAAATAAADAALLGWMLGESFSWGTRAENLGLALAGGSCVAAHTLSLPSPPTQPPYAHPPPPAAQGATSLSATSQRGRRRGATRARGWCALLAPTRESPGSTRMGQS